MVWVREKKLCVFGAIYWEWIYGVCLHALFFCVVEGLGRMVLQLFSVFVVFIFSLFCFLFFSFPLKVISLLATTVRLRHRHRYCCYCLR